MKSPRSHARLLCLMGLAICLPLAPHALLGQAAPTARQAADSASTVAFWEFAPASPALDSSGNGHTLSLRGRDSRFVEDERFAGALQIRDTEEPGDTRQGAATARAPELNFTGPMSIEMWVRPAPGLSQQKSVYLIDKKNYPTGHARDPHTGYLVTLRKMAGADRFRVEAHFGFGEHSKLVASTPIDFPPEQWAHLLISYNGEGEALLYKDGYEIGRAQWPECRAIAPSRQSIVLGDRLGSIGARFLGEIARVRLSSEVALPSATETVSMDPGNSRLAFERMERGAHLSVVIANKTGKELAKAALVFNGMGEGKKIAIPTLAPGASQTVNIPLDTQLKAGSYPCHLECRDTSGAVVSEAQEIAVTLVPRALPHRLPVIAWAWLGPSHFDALEAMGFTHFLSPWQTSTSHPVDFVTKQKIPEVRRIIDRAYGRGLRTMAAISPKQPAFRKKYGRVERNGKATERLNGLFPEVQSTWRQAGSFAGREFGDLPGFEGAMIGTETRDHTLPSFHVIDHEAWKQASGQEIPPEAALSRAVPPSVLDRLPVDKIIPDDDPLVAYYRWFWKTGDGWNRLYTEASEGLKESGRPGLWTWHDPAVRTPSIWGSGGKVDFLSNWTYTFPNPLKIALAADELSAMAKGNPAQGIMSMTQIIWYRSRTTTPPEPGKPVRDWEREHPKARFVTIAPDHLGEALWLQLAHPVKGIMYHGWGSLVGNHGSYQLTNPASADRLGKLTREVVAPLGPTLVQVPDSPTDIAFLQSFTSQILAGGGTYGWGRGWQADAYLIARHAALQPEIVYEETIAKTGLDAYKAIILTRCDVLSQSTASALAAFQQRGGLIIADEFLAPGIQPDIVLQSIPTGADAEADYRELLQSAAKLRAELDTFYQRPLDSDNPRVIVRKRSTGGADYLFAINDHRTFGDYIGHHRLVMEKGLPSRARLTLRRENAVVYDLVQQRPVPTEPVEGGTSFVVDLAGAGGAIFLALEKPVGTLALKAPSRVDRHAPAHFAIRLPDQEGDTLPAVIPMHVEIRDPEGKLAEFSGDYGAANGNLDLRLDFASNDLPGQWSITARERLSGQQRQATFELPEAAAPSLP